MTITANQREILEHTAYRAAGGFCCGDSDDMQELVRLGLMESAGRKSFVPDEYFKLTALGRESLKTPVEKATERLARTGSHRDLRRLNKAKRNAR